MADGTIIIETDLETDKLKNKLDKLNNDIERQTGKIKQLGKAYEKALNGGSASQARPQEAEQIGKQLEKARKALAEYNKELAEIKSGTADMLAKSIPSQVPQIQEIEDLQIEKLNKKYAARLSTLSELEHKAKELNMVETKSSTEQQKYIDELNAQLDEYGIKLDEITARYSGMMTGDASADAGFVSARDAEIEALDKRYEPVRADLESAESALMEIKKREAAAAAEAEKLRLQLEQAQIALERMEVDARGVEAQLEETQAPTGQMQQHLEAAQNSLGKFEKRLKTIAKKVFVFTMITAALRSVKAYMGQALEANEGFQNSLASLKGTLRTAFQPILDFIIPILQALINVLNAAISYVAKFTSWLFGSTVQASSAAAKALYDQTNATKAAGAAAEKAKKQMSGLDEMNTWQSDSAGGGGGSAAEPDVNFNGIKSAMGELEVYISGALLAIGAILAFTGVSIPLGITLMAIGAAGLASALSLDWNKMPDNIRSALTIVLGILGGAALVIGAILTFSGVNLPLGIGLMIAGAAMLGTAAALNWDKITQFISGDVAVLMSICGAALLVLGLILVASGAGLPLGIALIAIGALAFATPIALNWDALLTKIKSTWEKIKAWWNRSVAPKFTLKFWKQKFSSIAEGLTSKIKDGINAAIALFNRFVNWINGKMNIKWNAVKIAGLEVIPKGSFQLLKLNNIPRLAQGAVIPANREFMAVLGDQKNGRNLEAPEDLIRQIVREESGNGQYTFVAQLDGRTIFKEVIDQGKLSRRMTGKNAFALGGV